MNLPLASPKVILWSHAVIAAILLISRICTGIPVNGGENEKGDDIAPPPSSLDSLVQLNSGKSVGTGKDNPTLLTLDEAPAAADNSLRAKRLLETNEVSRKVKMIFTDHQESYESLNYPIFTAEDFIIRLQEKYEYDICLNYLKSVPNLHDNYFQYNQDHVNMGNAGETEYKGTEEQRKSRRTDALLTYRNRYRLHGEECDFIEEFNFWKEMFLAAENDTIGIPKKGTNAQGVDGSGVACTGNSTSTTGITCSNGTTVAATTKAPTAKPAPIDPNAANSDEFNYVQVEPKDMMLRWNKIWRKYENKGVCNQKLLLECRPTIENPNKPRCNCRMHGVGLSSIVLQVPVNLSRAIPLGEDFYTTQYYEDSVENVHGESVTHHGKYLHKKQCVVTANVPDIDKDAHILNPCDFYLPMIGMCRADCVVNATCKSVSEIEKNMLKSKKADLYTRVRVNKLHDVYHQKCVCTPGQMCRMSKPKVYSAATTIKEHETIFFLLLIIKATVISVIF